MSEAKKIADVDAEWERMIQDHAEKLGLDINGDRLEAQGNSNATRGRLRKRKIKHVKLQSRAGTGTAFLG